MMRPDDDAIEASPRRPLTRGQKRVIWVIVGGYLLALGSLALAHFA